MKKYLLSVVLALFAFNVSAQNNVIDEVIWVVGDEAILKSDVENARIEAQSRGQHIDGDPYCVIPEQLAIQKLFLHQAAIDSLEVSDANVFRQVDMELNSAIQNYGSREKLEEYLGMSLTKLRETRFENMKNSELVKMAREDLVKDIKVTPAQVRRYFKEMPEDSIPFVPTKVECQIITLQPKIEQEEIDRVKNELRSYTERVNSGSAKFSTLALMYSEDPGSARNGGEMDWSGRGMLVPEFANVAFNLTDPKTVSKIVETEFGFHIIQLIEKRGDQIKVRHILRKPRVSDDAIEKAVNLLDSVAGLIREGKFSFDEAAKGSDDKDTRNNYGIMMNPEDGSSRFEMRNLPVEVARAVANMNVNEISKPFIMTNNKGKEVVAIVKLRKKINGHRATMADDYQTLQDVVVGKLSEEKIMKWIREKQQSTYIHINEGWNNCEFQYPGWIK